MSDAKLVRVELEYDDSEATRIVGPAAQRWLEAVNGMAGIARVHGFTLDPVVWEQGTSDGPPGAIKWEAKT